jgi:hypothetical protein
LATIVGVHWPDLDEDIGVEGLVLGRRSREGEVSLAGWLATSRFVLKVMHSLSYN